MLEKARGFGGLLGEVEGEGEEGFGVAIETEAVFVLLVGEGREGVAWERVVTIVSEV